MGRDLWEGGEISSLAHNGNLLIKTSLLTVYLIYTSLASAILQPLAQLTPSCL